ncbi:hypothetical protein HY546_01005 [archaeon]|nr:hypothetical protein [archaeon]
MKLTLSSPLVREFVQKSAGDNALRIIRCLDKGLTDDQIAKRTRLEVNEIRAVLNRLHYLGVIIYSKEKSSKSNWYTYTWFLNDARIKELLHGQLREEHEKLREKLSMEEAYVFFKCLNGCEKIPFELAFEYDFKCPGCGNSMAQQNNSHERKSIERRIGELEKVLTRLS